MADYSYEAIADNGRAVKGTIVAENPDSVRAQLKSQGLIVTNVKEQGLLDKDVNLGFQKKVSPRDLSVFCRQFVSMSRAGVTILECLSLLRDQTENPRLAQAVRDLQTNVEKGETLASGLEAQPDVFPSLMCTTIAAGEASGSLEISLERMAEQFEKSAKTQAMVKKAMIYPILVCVVAVVVVIIMLVKVIPTYVDMFDDLDVELPGITKAVQAASNFLITKWFIVVPIVIMIALLIAAFRQTDQGIHFFGKLAITIPAVKNLTVKSASAMMARTLSTLLGSGVPLVESVGIVASTMTNVYFKEALEDAKSEVVIGQPLSVPLQACGLFPPMVYHMVRIGEESGNTEDMLDRMADYYEEEVEMAVQSLMAAMEPMIIIVLAIVVGTLVGACMAPMLTMYQALDEL